MMFPQSFCYDVLIRIILRRGGLVRRKLLFASVIPSDSARWWEAERKEGGKWASNVDSEVHGDWGTGTDFVVKQSSVQTPALNFPGCVILGMLLNFSELPFYIYRTDAIIVPTYRVSERIG